MGALTEWLYSQAHVVRAPALLKPLSRLVCAPIAIIAMLLLLPAMLCLYIVALILWNTPHYVADARDRVWRWPWRAFGRATWSGSTLRTSPSSGGTSS